jgi:hypothetical protein
LSELQLPWQGTIIHHDQDSVYTSYDWTGQLLLKDNVRVSYALGGAKDNPEMEGFISRFKTEGHSLFLDARSMSWLKWSINVCSTTMPNVCILVLVIVHRRISFSRLPLC